MTKSATTTSWDAKIKAIKRVKLITVSLVYLSRSGIAFETEENDKFSYTLGFASGFGKYIW